MNNNDEKNILAGIDYALNSKKLKEGAKHYARTHAIQNQAALTEKLLADIEKTIQSST